MDEAERAFLTAYVAVRYAEEAARDRALGLVGEGAVGERVRAGAVLREVELRRGLSAEDVADGDVVLFALEAPDRASLSALTGTVTEGGEVVTTAATSMTLGHEYCGCEICQGLSPLLRAVTPSHLEPRERLLFLQLRVDRGVRWNQLRTEELAFAALRDGTVLVELTGELDAVVRDALALVSSPGVLASRVLVGAGTGLRRA